MLTEYLCVRSRLVWPREAYNLEETIVIEAGVRKVEGGPLLSHMQRDIKEAVHNAVSPSLLRNGSLQTLALTVRYALVRVYPSTKLWVIARRAGDSVCAGVS